MQEFVEFLGSQSPYDQLDEQDLHTLARKGEVESFARGAFIVREGAPPLAHLYVVRSGSVEVLDRGRVVDVLGPGDTFGHISVLSGLAPALAVRAAEDTECYLLPDPRGLVAHPERLTFAHYGTLVARQRLITSGGPTDRLERPVTAFTRAPLWCPAQARVRDAAAAMTAAHRSSALVDVGGSVGVVDDEAIRRRVATGEVPLDAPVHVLAHVPAPSVRDTATVGAASLHMVEHGVSHLVVVDRDGLPCGVTSVLDLAAADVRHPLAVRSAVSAARTLDELTAACALLRPTLVELWDADVSSRHLSGVLAAVLDAVLRKLVELHVDDPGFVLVETSWMVMGSLGRREPLPHSDVDTALVWRSTSGPPAAAGRLRDAAGPVLDDLVRTGQRTCPHDANATHQLFNRSADAWSAAVHRWAADGGELHAMSIPGAVNVPGGELAYRLLLTTMLDARPVTGSALGNRVSQQLASAGRNAEVGHAVLHLALAERPPAGFVRGFVIGHRGERRRRLDLKEAGLRPVTGLARALAFLAGDPSGATVERVDRAVAAGLLTSIEGQTLIGAFELFHDLLTAAEIAAFREGRAPDTQISTADLDPLARRHLRSAFREVGHVQDHVRRRVLEGL